MAKINQTVKNETKYVALWVLIFSAVLQSVFLIINKWDYTVLLGNLLSGSAAVLNFLLMGITVQKAVEKEEKDAKSFMRLSQTYRSIFLLVITIIGVVAPCFNIWAVIIPLFFVRIAVSLKPLFNKK